MQNQIIERGNSSHSEVVKSRKTEQQKSIKKVFTVKI